MMRWASRKRREEDDTPAGTDETAPASSSSSGRTLTDEQVRQRRLARFGSLETATAETRATGERMERPPAQSAKPQPAASLPPPAPSEPPAEPQRPVATEKLVHQALARIFALDRLPTGEAQQLMQELQEDAATSSTLLSAQSVDPLIMERLRDRRVGDSFTHLLQCYQRARQELSSAAAARHAAVQHAVAEACRLVVSYARLSLLNPGLFECDLREDGTAGCNDGTARLLPRLLGDAPDGDAAALPTGFLGDLLRQCSAESDEELRHLLEPLFRQLAQRARTAAGTNLLDTTPVALVRCLGKLIEHDDAVRVLVEMPEFVVGDGGRYAPGSLLGAFFLPTAMPEEDPRPAQTLFRNAAKMSAEDGDRAIHSVQWPLHTLRQALHQVLMRLLRAGPRPRERTLQWLAAVLRANRDRAKLQYDPRAVAGTGFMFNLTEVMLRAAAPFADPRSPKLATIEARYLLRDGRIAVDADVTRVVADQARVAASLPMLLQEQPQPSSTTTATASASRQPFPFVAECFFVTLRLLELTLVPTLRWYDHEIERALQRLEEMRPDMDADVSVLPPAQRRELELTRARYEHALERLHQERLCYEAYLRDTEFLDLLLPFCACVAAWLEQQAGFRGRLPLPGDTAEAVPAAYACLPEGIVEVLAETLHAVWQFRLPVSPAVFVPLLPTLVEFITVFLSNPLYIRNPYLRVRMAEWIAAVFPGTRVSATAVTAAAPLARPVVPPELESVFLGNPLVIQHLPGGMLQLYVDAEFTGGHTQFFDKFVMRYYISDTLEAMWRSAAYHEVLLRESTQHEDRFVHFLNMVCNDANFLLDDSLTALKEIRDLQRLMDGGAEWEAMPAEARDEKRKRMQQLETQARSDNQLANSSVRLLLALSEQIRQPFLRPELLDRTTQMLNYFLVELCGPRCENLVVRDRHRYEWEPRRCLTQILTVYLHLYAPEDDADGTQRFCRSVATDGRSYKPEVFARALDIAQRRQLLLPPEVTRFQQFIGQVAQCAQQESAEDEQLGQAPEEFLDPIMATVMRDPVLLPSSRQVVDRATIVRHLLSDPHDPFNRQPLSADEVLPQAELKARIHAWIVAQKRARG
ncbi:hypothetical protein CDCA_CDCA17G4460 [Cyanidium caldarium]|uniref:RING-type E3 ubiquitin transferase n=1 Tax=Cyanidium caldarium TaxID=2771 RepID=A0AAV9J267_CYACA|nr:hypothetical protein CDCA_CDCA17G4460 [Cyanidium caldarium]